MAIDFNEKEKKNIDTKKIIILVVVLAIAIVLFLFFKNKGSNGSENEDPKKLFEPISIDFDFISSEKFNTLESFHGIPVLPGFFEASDKKTQLEKIEAGRENPFKEVSLEEIESAVTKIIEKIDTFEEIEEMRSFIDNFTLYTQKQKANLISKLEVQKKIIEEKLEEESNPEEIIMKDNSEEKTPEQTENIETEIIPEKEDSHDYFKEW